MTYSGVPYFRFQRRSMVRRDLGTAHKIPFPIKSFSVVGNKDFGNEEVVGETFVKYNVPFVKNKKNKLVMS